MGVRPFVAAGLGVLMGACAVFAWIMLAPQTLPGHGYLLEQQNRHRDYSDAGSLSRPELARLLLGRVSSEFVSDSRKVYPLKHGASFDFQPTPYGEFLCQRITISVPERIVRGPDVKLKGGFDEAISYEVSFGVWKKPGDVSHEDREQACAHLSGYDRFIRTETMDGTAIQRAVEVLDLAARQARSGKIGFKLGCSDERDERHPLACDGKSILGHLDVQTDLGPVSQIWTEKFAHGERHHYSVQFERVKTEPICNKHEIAWIDVTSTKTYDQQNSAEDTPTELNIGFGLEC